MSDLIAWKEASIPTAAQRTRKAQQRAADSYRRLNDKEQPMTSVAFKTAAGTILASQEVRLEWDNRASMVSSAAGSAAKMGLIVYGIRNHATRVTTDIKEGYRFVLNGDEYRCSEVIETLGERQGIFVAI